VERRRIDPRPEWRQSLEAPGLVDRPEASAAPAWREDACYGFRPDETQAIGQAAAELYGMCLKAVEHVLERSRFREYHLPRALEPLLRDSWERDEVSLCSRLDLAYDGTDAPKLLACHADVPATLWEAAVAQRHWLEHA